MLQVRMFRLSLRRGLFLLVDVPFCPLQAARARAPLNGALLLVETSVEL